MGCGLKSYNCGESWWVVCQYHNTVDGGGKWPCCEPTPDPDVCTAILA